MQTVVDLSRLRHNIRIIRTLTGNRFCAVVKSDAYGHGAAVASYIEPVCDCFFVATYDEATALDAMGIKKPILALGGDISPFLAHVRQNFVPTVFDAEQLAAAVDAGYNRFSVEIDTGMHRLGANEIELEKIVAECKMRGVAPWSVYSHIYGGISSARGQATEFDRLTADPILRHNRHLYSSCALDLPGNYLFDMTRGGIAMYGYSKYTEQCMKVRAKIVALAYVKRGEHVGYGDYTLERDSVIATVRCGYSDGLRRCDKRLYMTVRGEKCPIVGMPCMDLTMIDVTNVPCRVGEYAYLISGKEDCEYLAKCYNTIIYEVLTGFNGRAERIYM